MKLLSVAVPCYDVAHCLERCLNSFADPRLVEALEVLIVNDGSTDETRAIAERYVRAYPQVFRLIDQPNGGHGAAINAGIACATGKYFRVVDGDDWVETEELASLLGALGSVESDLIVDQKTEEYMDTGVTRRRPLPLGTPWGQELSFERAFEPRYIPHLSLHTTSARLSLLRRHDIRVQRHTYYVDFEFILKASAHARTAMFVNHFIYHYQLGNPEQSVDWKNYVRKHDHHDRVVREALTLASAGNHAPDKRDYVDHSVLLLIHTHLNIFLIYNENRAQGRKQAADFMRFLKVEYPQFYRKARLRYAKARALNLLGVNYVSLQKLRGR